MPDFVPFRVAKSHIAQRRSRRGRGGAIVRGGGSSAGTALLPAALHPPPPTPMAATVPPCKWAQRKERVYLTVDVTDATEVKVVFEAKKVTPRPPPPPRRTPRNRFNRAGSGVRSFCVSPLSLFRGGLGLVKGAGVCEPERHAPMALRSTCTEHGPQNIVPRQQVRVLLGPWGGGGHLRIHWRRTHRERNRTRRGRPAPVQWHTPCGGLRAHVQPVRGDQCGGVLLQVPRPGAADQPEEEGHQRCVLGPATGPAWDPLGGRRNCDVHCRLLLSFFGPQGPGLGQTGSRRSRARPARRS